MQENTGTNPSSPTKVRWLTPQRGGLNITTPSATIPAGAQLLRNIVDGLTFISSHIIHMIRFAGPDYKSGIDSEIYSGFFDEVYNEAIVAQRIFHEMQGQLGGKAPHQLSAIPGGFSQTIDQSLYDKIIALAQKEVPLDGDGSNAVKWQLCSPGTGDITGSPNSDDWIARRGVPFMLAMIQKAISQSADSWGIGSGHFVCAPTFDIVNMTPSPSITGDAYFRGGARISGTLKILDSSVGDTSASGASGPILLLSTKMLPVVNIQMTRIPTISMQGTTVVPLLIPIRIMDIQEILLHFHTWFLVQKKTLTTGLKVLVISTPGIKQLELKTQMMYCILLSQDL